MNKRFILIMAAIAAIFVGLIVFSKSKNSDTNGGGNNGGTSNAQASEHKKGAGKKGVTLIEYGDFQCPACFQYEPVVRQVIAKYGDDITFQFRNFPLVQKHQNAMAAHRAAEAAAKQDKFWEMHDLLYDRQQVWETSKNATRIMEDFATELSLNVEKFKQDFNSPEVNDLINADIKTGQALDITGTPTFVLNGKKLSENPGSVEEFEKIIDEAIKKANKQ